MIKYRTSVLSLIGNRPKGSEFFYIHMYVCMYIVRVFEYEICNNKKTLIYRQDFHWNICEVLEIKNPSNIAHHRSRSTVDNEQFFLNFKDFFFVFNLEMTTDYDNDIH